MITVPEVDVSTLPDVIVKADGSVAASQLASIANIAHIANASGLVPRLNMRVGDIEFFLNGASVGDAVMQEYAELRFMDLCAYCRIKARDQVREAIASIAKFDPFHPMEDWIKGLPPHQGDPIGDLINSVQTENPLWPVYVENWMIQVVEAVCGWRDRQTKKSIPHVLVLVGAQGKGKSQWLKRLGGPWFKGEAELHLSANNGKDHQIEALKYPMVELSELDGIFRKSDVSLMKSFISREEDSIRAPYARRAAIRPRMTAFCGSVNGAEFLNDTTGSRRFWPVQVDDIDWSYTPDLDNLWSQVYGLYLQDSSFDLTPEEDAVRAQIAEEEHTTVPSEIEKIAAYWDSHKHQKDKFRPMNRTAILNMLGYKNPAPVTCSTVGLWLEKSIGKHKKLTFEGIMYQRSWMFPYNELAHDTAYWAKPPALTLVKGGEKADVSDTERDS